MTDTKNELIVAQDLTPEKVFTTEGVQDVLKAIKEKVKGFIPDTSTIKGRKEIASFANKVAKSKTFLDKAGKELVSGWKNSAKIVDAQRKILRDELDELKVTVRKPLTDWEKEEEKRMEIVRLQVVFNNEHLEALEENERYNKKKELEEKEAELKAKEEALKKAEEEKIKRDQEEKEKRDLEEKERLEKIQREEEERQSKIKKENEEIQAKKDAIKKEMDEKIALQKAEELKVKAAKLKKEQAEIKKKKDLLKKEEEKREREEKANKLLLQKEEEERQEKIRIEEEKRKAIAKKEQDLLDKKEDARKKAVEKEEEERRLKIEKEESERKALAKKEQLEIEKRKAEIKRKEDEEIERQRIIKEKEEAEKVRLTDENHRRTINQEAKESFIELGVEHDTAVYLVKSIINGKIKNISLKY